MNCPEVSIITPAYNCEKTITETYNSIKQQSFAEWEWIIIEDHSTDNTFSFISEMVKNDKRVVLLRTQKNSGAAVARNCGIQNAHGRYIAFLDADDLWKVDKLEKQISFMKEKKVYFSYSDYELLFPDGKTKLFKSKKQSASYKDLLKKNDIGCLTVIYDALKIGKRYMPLDCEKREDHGAWLDITKNGIRAFKINEVLATYRIGEKTVSSQKIKMFKYQYRLYRRHEKFNPIKSLWYVLICSFNKIFFKY